MSTPQQPVPIDHHQHQDNDCCDHCEEAPFDAGEDQLCFLRTVESFAIYENHSHMMQTARLAHMRALSDEHKKLMGFDVEKLAESLEHCTKYNASFFNAIVQASQHLFGAYWGDQQAEITSMPEPLSLDIDKAYSTLRQFVRDWSSEGALERSLCYQPLIDKLTELYPNVESRGNLRVLVPGAGLSRLSFEISLQGFCSQGNEFSYHMLIAGHYILNHVVESEVHAIYPFADTSINNVSRAEQMRCVMVPDKSASEMLQERLSAGCPVGEFSMIAGEFVEVYSKPSEIGAWNSVVTCFFVDTAHNIIEYVQVIHKLLAPGGSWINLGPMLYHFSDMAGEASVDLTFDEFLTVVRNVGFEITEQKDIDNTYTNNIKSMKQNLFHSKFFVAFKKA
eukprot:PhM_4_TR1735/c0_g1_i1/m.102225/K19787/CARNMT1; carnosine N-methyltransferase